MNPVQYIIVQSGVHMSRGKEDAQVGHAAVEGYRLSCKTPVLSYRCDGGLEENHAGFEETSIVNRWRRGGHYAKIVLECDDLQVAERYIRDRGFKTALIIDEGRTEVEPLTPTAIGTEIVDKDSGHVQATFGIFKLRKDTPVAVIETDRKLTKEQFLEIKDLLAQGKPEEAKALMKRDTVTARGWAWFSLLNRK